MTMEVRLIAKADSRMTGLWRYVENLTHHLANQGIDATLTFPPCPMPSPLVRFGRKLGWDLATFFQSYPIWGDFGTADLYHLTSETLAISLLGGRVKPNVVTVHAFFTYLLRNEPGLSMYNHPLHKWFDVLAVRGLRRAQAIIAVSAYIKRSLIEQMGIPPERIHVIPEAVDLDFFRPQEVPDAFREKYGLHEKWKYILYVGSEQPRKNFRTLVRAFARLYRRFNDVRLLKVGQPEIQQERERTLRLIEELGIEDAVIFCGHIEDELPLFYNVSHIFVFPSLYEGFGFPPLEAMACGTPVICSNTTSLPEVVGDAALLFDPLDEDALVDLMEQLLVDEKLRKEHIRRGLENARRFDWAITACRTIDVYRQVLSRKGV